MNLFQRFATYLYRLANVSAVPIGRPDDGLSLITGGTEHDKPWGDLKAEFGDALDAWRKNPLARRIIGLVTAYTVGNGITLSADGRANASLSKFITAFYGHPQNNLLLRQAQWCEELSRAGELFITLHTNPADGMSYVRAIPASVIDKITWRPGDYESELTYHETVPVDDPDYGNGGRLWISPLHESADGRDGSGRLPPLMMHFAVNRPVGCVRGETDLAPILPWLRRYTAWLEDRVRLNALVRAFVWVVRVATGSVADKEAEYKRPPEPGSVVVIEKDSEEWEAVTPNLNAADAANDGKAIRWQIAAGSPGLGLADFGEADESNLATAKAMSEQRRRFMEERQSYFGFVLAYTTLTAYNRAVRMGAWKGREKALSDIRVEYPPIASQDTMELGTAAKAMADAITAIKAAGFDGETFKRRALQLVLRFAGEEMTDADMDKIITESDGMEEAPAGVTDVTMAPITPGEADAAQLAAMQHYRAALMLATSTVNGNGHHA